EEFFLVTLLFLGRFLTDLMASVVGLSMKRGKSKADASNKADNSLEVLLGSGCTFFVFVFSRLSVKKGSERVSKKPRKLKAAKDPNKPKRPASAFFVFMWVLLSVFLASMIDCLTYVVLLVWNGREEFRKSFKEKNPNNKSVSVVNSFPMFSTDPSEKVPYVTKAAKLKTEYTKKLATYNNDQVQFPHRPSGGGSHAAADEVESDKSNSEVNDDEEEEEGSEEEEEEDE
ncbi:hypothetical protein BHM03_00022398, partial [Ensete ventricosum]